MKYVCVISFILFVALCNGVKFPFQQRNRGGADVKGYDEEVNAMMELTMPKPIADEREESPEGEIVVEETIAPVTANLLGSESNPACDYCRGMFGGCYCEDVEWCRGIPCEVKQECDEKCKLYQNQSLS
ncbi:unnamed protein product [Pocillopora meandrina]|uniref:Uncharacterized protein n=1 Tax=Pocillopora meandrina TaxID=46732 RepID=A0AAU9XCR0_9CNID|nr:unnamed protein product [Pocillopora meandrina]